MEFSPIQRAAGDFQQPVSAAEILALSCAAFGSGTDVLSAIELGGGFYNSTFKVDIGQDRPVILRVAPAPARHARADPELMRNEYASAPYLAPIAHLLPRNLAVDFTHQVIGRDYLFQTLLDGIAATKALNSYPQSVRGAFYGELGQVTRMIHSVQGARFGPVGGPTFGR